MATKQITIYRTPGLEENQVATMVQTLEEGELSIRESGDTLVLNGDLDLYEAPHFRTAAEDFIRRTPEPRFDMRDVPFLDSAGLATLLYLSRQAANHHKTLRILIGGGPRRVLKITGIDRLLVVEEGDDTDHGS